MRRLVLPILVLFAGCADGSPSGAVTAAVVGSSSPARVSTSTAPHPPPADSSAALPSAAVPTSPVVTAGSDATVTTSSPSSDGLPHDDVVTGLFAVQDAVIVCLTSAATCDTASVAVPGSPAHTVFEEVRQQYVRRGLTVALLPELTYVVVEDVRSLDPDRAVVTLCEVDGSWQMDTRGTPETADDIVWNDQLVSRRATHELVRTPAGWRRYELLELDLWRGENRCPPRPAA